MKLTPNEKFQFESKLWYIKPVWSQ